METANAAAAQDMHATPSQSRQCLHRMTSLKLDAPLTPIIPDILSFLTSPSVSLCMPLLFHEKVWLLFATGIKQRLPAIYRRTPHDGKRHKCKCSSSNVETN